MRSKAIFVALLALSFTAQAASVSPDQAARAARAWVNSGGSLVAPAAGATATSVRQHSVSVSGKAVPFYTVKMSNGGTVFVSGSTKSSPIIAFSSSTTDFSSIDEKGPLWALLAQDAQIRNRCEEDESVAEAPQWGNLLAEASEATAGSVGKAAELDDVRVFPLVQSRWNQAQVGGVDCFNRFTPVLSDGTHAVCGCVATAMAQVMRYHRFPQAAVDPVTNKCFVEVSVLGKTAAATNLVLQGGVYDWSNMPIVPTAPDPEAGESEQIAFSNQCAAIGKLTSDAGIAVYMSYDAGGSGAFSFNIVPALKNVFGYANADFYKARDNGSGIPGMSYEMQRAMFANFDAGYPVLMGISGAGGHQIVGDGYGYKDGQPYVHLNMGWGSADDVWYNLPQIDCEAAGHKYTVFNDVVFNIFPSAAEKSAVLSGRVVDAAGDIVSNALVTVLADGEAVASATNSERGVYGFRIEPGRRYDVRALTGDELVGRTDGILVDATEWNVVASKTGKIGENDTETYYGIPEVRVIGNSWGNEVCVSAPSVRRGDDLFIDLDEALAAAVPGEVNRLEILRPAGLGRSHEVSADIVLVATNENPMASEIVRADGAVLTVAAAGSLSLTNVVFSSAAGTVVDVASGGLLSLGGMVGFGVTNDVAAVRTADAEGLELVGALGCAWTLACDAAQSIGETFGFATCDAETAVKSAALVANAFDKYGEQLGTAESGAPRVPLVWSERPVAFEDCAGYFVESGDQTNVARRLDLLLEKYAAAAAAGTLAKPEIVIRNRVDLQMSRPFAVTSELTLRGESGVVISNFTGEAGITVADGGNLTIDGIVFDGYVGLGLVTVDGDGAELTVTDSVFRNIRGTGTRSGALSVLKGSAVVTGGSVFENCRVEDEDYQLSHAKASGGAICLEGANSRLTLSDSLVTNCWASTSGGGVYVGNGAWLGLGGQLLIADNTAGYSYYCKPNDVYVEGKASVLSLEAPLSGPDGSIGVQYSASPKSGFGNGPGDCLVTVASAVSDPVDLRRSCAVFFNDCDEDGVLSAEWDSGAAAFRWTEEIDTRVKEGDEDKAVVRVENCGAAANGLYYRLEDAVAVLDGAATLVVLKDCTFANDLEIAETVVLTGDASRTITRIGDVSVRVSDGGQLTLQGIVFDGGDGRIGCFDVIGGSLTLDEGAKICGVTGSADRASGAVSVAAGGTFTMKSGSEICNCINTFADTDSGAGYCGGLLVDHGTAYLTGGVISGCRAFSSSGAFIGNGSQVFVSGDFTCVDNRSLDGEPANLMVAHQSEYLVLDGELTGAVGYTEGERGDTEVFGEVAKSYAAALELANSAHRFVNDRTRDVGQAVTNATGRLLVWSSALDGNSFTRDGQTYYLVEGGDPISVKVPAPVDGLFYTGDKQVGVPAGIGYSVAGGTAVNAGAYTATVSLKPGYVWEGGSSGDQPVEWTIAKAALDVRTADFVTDFIYDGKPKFVKAVEGSLPDGVTIRCEGDGQVGDPDATKEYPVQVWFDYDADNYDLIASGPLPIEVTLNIVKDPQEYPDPGPTPEPVQPLPIAFASIANDQAAHTWTVAFTQAVATCWYSLYETNSLVGGFKLEGISPVAIRQATAADVPEMTFTRPENGEHLFWKVVAEPSDAH